MAQGLLSPDDMMMQYAPSDVGLLSLPVDEGSRGMILPFATRGGKITAAMPQFLVDMGRAISAPYRAYTGELGDPMRLSGMIPNEVMYRDFFKTLEGATTKSGAPQTASMKQYTTRLNNPYQVVDQELVDTMSGLLEY